MKNTGVTLIIILALSAAALAQASGRDVAIAVFKTGDIDRAIPLLEKAVSANASDAELLNYTGLAFMKKADGKKARKFFENAVKLEPGNTLYRANLANAYLMSKNTGKARAEVDRILAQEPQNLPAMFVRGKISLAGGHIDQALMDAEKVLSLAPLNPQAHTLKADAIFQRFVDDLRQKTNIKLHIDILSAASETLKNCLEKCADNPEKEAQENRLELVSALLEAAGSNTSIDLEQPQEIPDPTYSRVKIISKPRASFTDEARRAGISGNVKLLIVFGKNGDIPYIFVLEGLRGGLTEQALMVARQIRFEPKMREGKPVTTVLIVAYGFTIY